MIVPEMTTLDVEHLRRWVGKTQQQTDENGNLIDPTAQNTTPVDMAGGGDSGGSESSETA